ncbi:MAG: hypothetical protein ACRD5G_05710 [Candidatus Acidiferrales bacterium]
MSRQKNGTRFVVCVDNRNHPASLELRKIYRALGDPEAARHGYVRVVDESGEDYLYPNKYFLPIALPKSVKKALRLAS